MSKQRLSVDDIVRMADGPSRLGKLVGVSRQTVYGWLATDSLPGARVAQICAALRLPPERVLRLARPPRRRSGDAEPRDAH